MTTFPLSRRLLLRQIVATTARPSATQRRKFTITSVASANPSEYVQGVTKSHLENNPAIAAYFAANFPDHESEQLAPDNPLEESVPSADDDGVAGEEQSGTAGQKAMNVRTLFCYPRSRTNERKTRACNRLREDRLIPGIIYGSDPNQKISAHDPSSRIPVKTPWDQIHRELDLFRRSFESHVYDLTLYEHPDDDEGTVHRVLPRDVQLHPLQNKVYCVNYLRYYPGRPIRIPIVYVNEEESPAMKRGGFIAPINRFVKCVVEEGVRIPDHLELECTSLKLKEVVRMDRIIFPDGVRPTADVDKETFLVGTVFGRRAADDAVEGGEDEKED